MGIWQKIRGSSVTICFKLQIRFKHAYAQRKLSVTSAITYNGAVNFLGGGTKATTSVKAAVSTSFTISTNINIRWHIAKLLGRHAIFLFNYAIFHSNYRYYVSPAVLDLVSTLLFLRIVFKQSQFWCPSAATQRFSIPHYSGKTLSLSSSSPVNSLNNTFN